MSETLDRLVDLSMVVGPVAGYIYQIWLIKKNGSLGTFSIDVCGILLFSNIARLDFYIFKPYKKALFLQAVLMIIVQLLLLYMCKRVSSSKMEEGVEGVEGVERQGADNGYFESFWRWPFFLHYFLFVAGYAALLTGLSFIMLDADPSGYYGEILGLGALVLESVLILPQILLNIQKGMVKGVSHLLLSFNLFGDIFKLCYFLIHKQPYQFILCGITQVTLDTFVILQIFYYRCKNKKAAQEEQGLDKLDEEVNGKSDFNPSTPSANDKKEDVQAKPEPEFVSNQQLSNKRRGRRRVSHSIVAKTTDY